jgi:hypothetical protein
MNTLQRFGTVSLLAVAVLLAGCPDARQAIVVNGSSNNASSVDLSSGEVTPDLGGITLGPVPNRIETVGTTAYVVNSGGFPGSANASLQVIDLAANTIVNTIPVPDGENPWALAIVNPNKIYVTMLYGNNVTIIDPTLSGASAVLGTIPLPVFGTVPAGPAGIIVVGGYAYTANSGYDAASWGYAPGSVSVIDTATDTIVDVDGDPANGTDTPIFTTGVNTQDLAVDGEGEIHVVSTGDYWSAFGVVDVIDPASRSVVASIPVGGTPGNISIGGDFALIGAGDADSCDLYVYKTDTNAVWSDSASPAVLTESSGWCTVGKIAVSASGRWAYVPIGVWGAEAWLLEMDIGTKLNFQRIFNLAPGANLPSAVGLVY